MVYPFLHSTRLSAYLLFASTAYTYALIPASPREQTARAIRSLKKAIDAATSLTVADDDSSSSNTQKPLYKRFLVDYIIPLPPETASADVDPWPGGIAQMYPYAETILKEILKGVTKEPTETVQSQVIASQDCCGFFIQESQLSAADDVAAIMFPGVDQLEKIQEIDQMVGEKRTLLLFNKQFRRPADFGFNMAQNKANQIVFDRFTTGFAFEEFACRGEDCKILFEWPSWSASVICDDDVDLGRREYELYSSLDSRPAYDDLEAKINTVLPEPLWMRKMGEVGSKGFRFQRGGGDSNEQ